MFPQLFHSFSTRKSKEKELVTETLRTLIDARFDRLEEKVRCVEREWKDVYDKIMLLYDRTRKRIKAAEKASGEEIASHPIPEAPLTKEQIMSRYLRNGDE